MQMSMRYNGEIKHLFTQEKKYICLFYYKIHKKKEYYLRNYHHHNVQNDNISCQFLLYRIIDQALEDSVDENVCSLGYVDYKYCARDWLLGKPIKEISDIVVYEDGRCFNMNFLNYNNTDLLSKKKRQPDISFCYCCNVLGFDVEWLSKIVDDLKKDNWSKKSKSYNTFLSGMNLVFEQYFKPLGFKRWTPRG